nr:MAG TPA: hypothetical protein [Caudoviricetes sp.]
MILTRLRIVYRCLLVIYLKLLLMKLGTEYKKSWMKRRNNYMILKAIPLLV